MAVAGRDVRRTAAGDVIADVGCGTGSLAVLLGRVEPHAQIIGLDPDREVLALARNKAEAAGITVDWRVSMGDALVDAVGANTVDTVVSSLVLHQCPLPMKRAVLASIHEVLKPGGKVVIADFGLQRTALMRMAFRIVAAGRRKRGHPAERRRRTAEAVVRVRFQRRPRGGGRTDGERFDLRLCRRQGLTSHNRKQACGRESHHLAHLAGEMGLVREARLGRRVSQ